MPYLLQWFTATDQGPNRTVNEDSVQIVPDATTLEHDPAFVPPGGRLCAVADGMGGHQGGQQASAMVVRRIIQHYYAQLGDSAEQALEVAIQQTSQELVQVGQSDAALQGMGSTLVVAVAENERVCLANVGDSRAYLWRDDHLQLLSEDDRWVTGRLREGLLNEEEARQHIYRNVLTQHLGSPKPITPHVRCLKLRPEDRLLLCTDGLFEVVSDALLKQTLAGPPEQAAARLVQLAVAQHAPDNITAAVGYYGPARPTARRIAPLLISAWAGGIMFVLVIIAVLLAALVGRSTATKPEGSPSAVSFIAPTSTVRPAPTARSSTPQQPLPRIEMWNVTEHDDWIGDQETAAYTECKDQAQATNLPALVFARANDQGELTFKLSDGTTDDSVTIPGGSFALCYTGTVIPQSIAVPNGYKSHRTSAFPSAGGVYLIKYTEEPATVFANNPTVAGLPLTEAELSAANECVLEPNLEKNDAFVIFSAAPETTFIIVGRGDQFSSGTTGARCAGVARGITDLRFQVHKDGLPMPVNLSDQQRFVIVRFWPDGQAPQSKPTASNQ